MKILVTGCSGYIGTPLCFELREKNYELVGIDNRYRNKWVAKCGGKDRGCTNNPTIYGDMANMDFVNEIIAIHKPDVIIHLASQPSMPYSQINGERALFTQQNNISMLVNILWAIKDLPTRLIITTTTGIPGQVYSLVPEGPTQNAAGSWYHVSRGFDSANCSLAARQWGKEIIELRTSIVYGLQTELMRKSGIATRFDTDPYFGTALNRFVDQAINGKPITIYGKGEQVKPFISLEDCVQSIVNAIEYPVKGHEIFNQVTQCVSINRLAKAIELAIPVNIKHIENPRKEKEDFEMQFENEKFLKLLGKTPVILEDEIGDMIKYLKNPTERFPGPKADKTITR